MRIELYSDVYKWLIAIQVLKPDLRNHIIKQNGKTEIDEASTTSFYTGVRVGQLLNILDPSFKETQQLKDMNTPTARLFNWNVLLERLKRLGIELDADIKALIVGGDLEMIAEVLKDIYDLQKQKGNISQVQASPQLKNNIKSFNQTHDSKKASDILNNTDLINSAKSLNQTEHTVEFILVSLCHNMSLKPKQAAQLLANGNKLLAHICVKGVKNQYQPVTQWLQELYQNWAKMIDLCKQDESSIQFLLDVLKSTLYSKEEEVAHWGLRLYTKIAFELANVELLFHQYQWTVKEGGGFLAFVLAQQLQPQLGEAIAGALLQIARYDIQDMFTMQMRKFFDSVKVSLDFFNIILPYLAQSARVKDIFIENGVLQVWLEQAMKLADPEPQNTRDHRISGIGFLLRVWQIYPSFIEQHMQTENQILTLLQKATRDHSQALRIFTVIHSFKLLDSLATQKMASATMVYRKLCSILVENYQDFQQRELLLKQFILIITKYPSIPLDYVVEPLVKVFQSNQSINIFDCEFYKVVTGHPNIKVNSAILMLDALVRLYNSNLVFTQLLYPSIQQLLQKFIERPEFQEFVLKMATVSLTIYEASIRNKKANKGSNNVYQLDEDSVTNSQKRALIIELIKSIIGKRSYSMNEMLKPLLVSFHLELKNVIINIYFIFLNYIQIEQQTNKGVYTLLTLLGNPDNIIEEVIAQSNQQQGISQSELISDRYWIVKYSLLSSNLFLEKKLQRIGGGQPKVFGSLNQERKYEQDLANQNSQWVQDQQKSFLDQTKDARSIFITAREEEEALMKQLIGDQESMGRQIKKKVVRQQQGGNKISPIQQDEWQCIYEENELAYVDVPPIEAMLINFDEEEDIERQSINGVFKTYFKTFRYLFSRYVVNEKEAAKKRLLQEGTEERMIRISDIFRMLRDYEIQDFSTYEEVIGLVQSVSQRYGQYQAIYQQAQIPIHDEVKSRSQAYSSSHVDKSQISTTSQKSDKTGSMRLDFECFCKFVAQYAMLIFSRPPRDLRKLPAGQVLLELFKFFANNARRKNENHLIFEDPDGITTVTDKQTISKFNLELVLHPDMIIPETTHLKKVAEEEINLNFAMKKKVIKGLPETFIFCYEIVNDIFQNKFKINIIEPISTVKVVYKVKPIAGKGLHKDTYADPILERQENLRLSLASLPSLKAPNKTSKKRMDLLNKSLELSVSPDLHNMSATKGLESTKITNKHTISKMVEEQEKLLKSEIKDIKWQSRKDYLDKQHRKIKDHLFDKELERIKKQAEEVENKVNFREKLGKPTSGEVFMKDKRDQLRGYKSQIISTLKEIEDQKFVKIKEKEDKHNAEIKKDVTQAIKKTISKLHAQSEETHKLKEDEKKEIEKERKKHQKIMEKAKVQAEHYELVKKEKIEFNQKFKNLYNDSGVQAHFKRFANAGERLFKYYLQYSDTKNQSQKQIIIDGWAKFTQTFNVYPDIIPEDQAKQSFYQTLNSKNHLNDVKAKADKQVFIPESGLNYFEFEQALLRLAIKTEQFLNKIYGAKDLNVIAVELIKFREEQASKPLIKKFDKHEDKMRHLENTKSSTVESLLQYLNVPDDNDLLAARIRTLLGKDVKPITEPRIVPIDVKKAEEEEAVPKQPQERTKKTEWAMPGSHIKLSPEKKQELENKEKEEKNKQTFKEFTKRNNKVEKLQKQLDQIQGKPKQQQQQQEGEV